MNRNDFDKDKRISQMGKAAFLILMIIALISVLRNTISIVSFILITGIFLAAYGKELIKPFLGNELRLLLHIGNLGISFIKLFIILLRTKGIFTKRDLDIMENYFTKEYNKEIGLEVREFVKKNFYVRYSLNGITKNISLVIRGKEKAQLIHQLFLFCEYTGGLTPAQKKIISKIAKGIKLNIIHLQNIENKFAQKNEKTKKQSTRQNSKKKYYRQHKHTTYSSLSHAYNVLGIAENVSNQDLQKIYRKLAKKYHPDKWHRNNAMDRQKAKEKFQKINNAYSIIKKSRNLK
jgi:DnaJ like chaperone protein